VRWLARLIVLALAVGAIREMRDRQQKLSAMGEDLQHQHRGLAAAERELDATDRSIDDAESRVHELDVQITAIERDHPGGIPAGIQPEYARLIEEHNEAVALHNDLVARQRRLNDEYKARVDRHNARVADANAYAAAGGPCSLLPSRIRARVCSETD
jgi:ParB-like chromosome segregation protein Spo0J